jgi:hypothetical protein
VTFDAQPLVHECSDLSAGEEINAWKGSHLIHSGTIADLIPAMGLFWIRERALGERRLLDMSDLEITRVPWQGNAARL